MPDISNSYQWMIDVCNAPNVGYSQAYRDQQTVNGIIYYDCSSIIWYSLMNGGFDVVKANGGETWPFTTYSMEPVLVDLGFQLIPIEEPWLPGDILVSNPNITNHTEMVYQGNLTMGAHSSKPPLPDQVSIRTTPSSIAWRHNYRFGEGASGKYEWIYGGESEYLPYASQKNNAQCIYGFFYYKGWSLEAIAGFCGNVQQESTFNPRLIEIGGTGHGLVQWTPPEDLYKVLDAVYGNHDDWWDGDKQLNAVYAEFEQSTGRHDWGIEPQWYQTPNYRITWDEWASSYEDPGYLALAFEANYERPGSTHPERAEYARQWYEFLKTVNPWAPPIVDNYSPRMPLYMYRGFDYFI